MALNRLEVNQQDQKAFFDARFEPQGNFIDCENVRVECDDECREENELSRADVQNRGIRTRKVFGTTVVIDACKDESKNACDKKINLNEINIQLEGSNILEKLKDFPRIFNDSSSNLGVTFKCETQGSCMSTKETEITVNVTTSKPKQTVCPRVGLKVESAACSDKENEVPGPCPKLCVKKIDRKPCKKETPEKSPQESPKDSPNSKRSVDSNKLKDILEHFRNSQRKKDPEPPKSPKKNSIELCKPKEIHEHPKTKRKSLDSGQHKLEDQDYKIVELRKPDQKINELVPVKKPRKICKVRCCGVTVVIAEDKNCVGKAHCCSKKRRKCCCDCRCCSPRNEKRNDLKEHHIREKREASAKKRLSSSIRKRLSGSTRRKRGGSHRGRRDTRPDDDDASDYTKFSDARSARKPSTRTKKSKFSYFSDNVSDKESDRRRKKKSKFSLFQSDESYESEEDVRNRRHKKSGMSTIQTDDTDDDQSERRQSERRISRSSEKTRGTTAYDESEESKRTRKSIPRKRFSFFKSDETDYKSDHKSDGRKSGKRKKFSFYKSDETDRYNGAGGGKRRSILKTDASDFDERRRRISKSDPFPSQGDDDDDEDDEAPKFEKRPSMFSRMKTMFKKK